MSINSSRFFFQGFYKLVSVIPCPWGEGINFQRPSAPLKKNRSSTENIDNFLPNHTEVVRRLRSASEPVLGSEKKMESPYSADFLAALDSVILPQNNSVFMAWGLNPQDAWDVLKLALQKAPQLKDLLQDLSFMEPESSLLLNRQAILRLGEALPEIHTCIQSFRAILFETLAKTMQAKTYHTWKHAIEMESDCKRLVRDTLQNLGMSHCFVNGAGELAGLMALTHDVIQGYVPPINERKSQEWFCIHLKKVLETTPLDPSQSQNDSFWKGIEDMSQAIVSGTYLLSFMRPKIFMPQSW